MSDVLHQIKRTYQLLNSLPPAPLAVWCIDRTDYYYEILSYCLNHNIPVNSYSPPFTVGLRIENWTSVEIAERIVALTEQGHKQDFIGSLFPFREPGVWIQMSKPPHIQISTLQQAQEIIK